MIAFAKPTVRAHDVHAQFLTMLPWISNLARRASQRFNSERRNDLVHEVIATAYVAFARLVEQGKQDLAYATPLANFAIRRVLDGRRAGSAMPRNDVMFDAGAKATSSLFVSRIVMTSGAKRSLRITMPARPKLPPRGLIWLAGCSHCPDATVALPRHSVSVNRPRT
jgi:hypothetical protein